MKASFKLKGSLGPVALALLLTGCGARAYEGGGDSNSNWLKSCDPDADCGSGLECLCGICTMQCASNRACGDDEEATCDVPMGCEQPVAVCTPREKQEQDADTTNTRGTDGGKTTDTTDENPRDKKTDTTIVDTVSDTTTGDTRADDSDQVSDTTTGEVVDTVSDTTTGEGTDTTDFPTNTTATGTTTGTGPDATTGPGTNTETTGTETNTGTTGPGTWTTTTVPTGTGTNTGIPGTDTGTTTTVPTGTGDTTSPITAPTTTGAETGVPENVGDSECSSAACVDGSLCFEPNGRHCECPPRSELSSCEGLLFQTLPLPDSLQSCVTRAVSGDGTSVVGMCQVVDGPNLAVKWGPDGAEIVTGVEIDLTHGLGITDDGLTSYWLASDGSTIGQDNELRSFFLVDTAAAFSSDASVIVGTVPNNVRGGNAFRWTDETGTQLLDALYDLEPRDAALAVSADGQTAVGYANSASGEVPARWNASGEVEALPLLDGMGSGSAKDVSADGSVIVGGGYGQAVRWTASGVELLLDVDDGVNEALLVTRDGTRVFGQAPAGAWMWDETNGIQSLETLLGMDASWIITHVADVSADGTTIVGTAQLNNDFSPWRAFAFRGRLPAP